ncbi:MAG TPA: 3-methyl-2-oxobutanoate hydroxymethyltransferase [Candidatus Dormibacteraeota bacterium]
MTTVLDVQRFKVEGRRFAMLTAYDATMAGLLDAAGIPVLLVGDSLGMVTLGYSTTVPVTLEDMVHHAAAVARGAAHALLVGDLPFGAYQASPEQALASAARLLKEGGVHAVKLEGGAHMAGTVRRLVENGIPVMAHIGLTPQSVNAMGGFKVQGRTPEQANELFDAARMLEAAGAFAIVLEGMPSDLAGRITRALHIPTIGIGAGAACDGQVLVVNDLLGLSLPGARTPRFVKRYAELGEQVVAAARAYAAEVEAGVFPDAQHSYGPAQASQSA